MAARENQGYLIAVIILVLLCLILALTSFLGIFKAYEYSDTKNQAELALKKESRLREAYEIQSQILRALIGEQGESVAEVETFRQSLDALKNGVAEADRSALNDVEAQVGRAIEQYDTNKRLFLGSANNEQAAEPTYLGLVRNFSSALSRLVNDNLVSQNEQVRIQREAKAQIDAKQKEVEQTQQAMQLVQSDLNKKIEEYENYKTTMTQTLESIQRKVKEVEDDRNTIRATLSGQIETLKVDIASQEQKYKEAKARLDRYEKENWDLADGKIVRVSKSDGNVFLNLGSKDGLKTTRTFSVFDANTTNFEKQNPKASIEVTRVWDHQAEARITNEDPLNPILPDDQLINPVWDPGYSVPIALAGEFDLDHDGFDDRERLIQMIQQNGGKVVAYHDSEGNVIGELDSATRWFVVGDSPVMDVDSNPEVIRAMRTMRASAEQYQIQEIDTRKLLNWMGQHSQPVIERLDSGIGSQFRRSEAKR